MKLNIKEFLHYIVGGIALLIMWQPLMGFFKNDIYLTSAVWIIWYIIIDQILHFIIKNEKINIIVG